jgi:hypothetical protein
LPGEGTRCPRPCVRDASPRRGCSGSRERTGPAGREHGVAAGDGRAPRVERTRRFENNDNLGLHPEDLVRPKSSREDEGSSRTASGRVAAGCVPTRRRSGWDEPRLEHPRACPLRVFVSSCEVFPASSLTRSPNETRLFLITRSHEDTKRSCWVHPLAGAREARTGHSRTAYAGIGCCPHA